MWINFVMENNIPNMLSDAFVGPISFVSEKMIETFFNFRNHPLKCLLIKDKCEWLFDVIDVMVCNMFHFQRCLTFFVGKHFVRLKTEKANGKMWRTISNQPINYHCSLLSRKQSNDLQSKSIDLFLYEGEHWSLMGKWLFWWTQLWF